MTGRADSEPSGDDPAFENLNQILDLNVKDFKPGMPRVIPAIFSNPDSDPRFPDVPKGGESHTLHVQRLYCTVLISSHLIFSLIFSLFIATFLSFPLLSYSILTSPHLYSFLSFSLPSPSPLSSFLSFPVRFKSDWRKML
jgi:hypothetical protein